MSPLLSWSIGPPPLSWNPFLSCSVIFHPNTPRLTCRTAPGLVPPPLSLLFPSGFHSLHFSFLPFLSLKTGHRTEGGEGGSWKNGQGLLTGASGLLAEVFREGPCVTGALHLFRVFPMLRTSQALRGAEVEGGSGR